MPKRKRIGIFPGTFDPIHEGHIGIARSAMQQQQLDMVYFMVEAIPWTNKQPESIPHRREMVRLATQNSATMSQLIPPEDQFSIRTTLPHLVRMFPDTTLVFIFGADVFMRMNPSTWPGLQQLLSHTLLIAIRNDIREDQIVLQAKRIGAHIAVIPHAYPHSSSDVRMQRTSRDIWVPKSVASYISHHDLYTTKE